MLTQNYIPVALLLFHHAECVLFEQISDSKTRSLRALIAEVAETFSKVKKENSHDWGTVQI